MAIHVEPVLMNLDSREESNGQGSSFPSTHVREVFRAISAQMRQLQKERSEITSRVEQIKKVLVGLASMYGHELPEAEVDMFLGRTRSSRRSGLTNYCRRILLDLEKPGRAQHPGSNPGKGAALASTPQKPSGQYRHYPEPAGAIWRGSLDAGGYSTRLGLGRSKQIGLVRVAHLRAGPSVVFSG